MIRQFFKVENGIWLTCLFLILFSLGLKLEAELLKQASEVKPQQLIVPENLASTEADETEDVSESETQVTVRQQITIPDELRNRITAMTLEEFSQYIAEQNKEKQLPIWLALIKDYLRDKNTRQSRKIIEVLLSEFSTHRDVLFQYARLLAAEKNPREAIAVYQTIVRDYPNHQTTYINLGLLLTQIKDYTTSNEILKTAIAISASDKRAKAWSLTGTNYHMLGDYQAAEHSFYESIKLRPDHASTWRKLALVQYLGGDATKSIETLENALALSPAYLLARLDRIRIAEVASVPIDDNYKQLVKDFPESNLAREWLAFYYLTTGRHRSLQKIADKLQKQVQSKADKRLWSGVNDLAKKRYKTALKKLNRAKQSDEWSYLYKSYVLSELRQYQQARLELSGLKNSQWFASYATAQRILILIKEKQFAKAETLLATYEREVNQQHWIPVKIELLRSQGQHQHAVTLFNRLFSTGYDSFSLQRDYADSLRRSGQLINAVMVYESLHQKKPTLKKLQLDLARCYSEAGNSDAANDTIDALLKRAPEYKSAIHLKLSWLQKQSDWINVKALAETSIPFHPDSVDIRVALFNALTKLGDDGDLDVARRLIKLNPESKNLNWQLFNLFKEKRLFDEAIMAWYKMSEKRQQKHSSRLFNLALAARREEQLIKAIEIFELFLNYQPTHERAKNYIIELKGKVNETN